MWLVVASLNRQCFFVDVSVSAQIEITTPHDNTKTETAAAILLIFTTRRPTVMPKYRTIIIMSPRYQKNAKGKVRDPCLAGNIFILKIVQIIQFLFLIKHIKFK